MWTHARKIYSTLGIVTVGLMLGCEHLAAQTPSKEGSAEMRFWDWTSLDFPAEEYAARRERLLDGLAAELVPGR